jgi:hypothetical protein
MAGTHGDLFREIGILVVRAHEGDAIDLREKAHDLARRYGNLGMPADMIARAIARSASAVGVSMAMMQYSRENGVNGANGTQVNGTDASLNDNQSSETGPANGGGDPPAVLLPSGVRLAVLS